mgnify:CR=1 FL=1
MIESRAKVQVQGETQEGLRLMKILELWVIVLRGTEATILELFTKDQT